MRRRNPSMKREPDNRPWSESEDAAIIEMVEIGLCVKQCSFAYRRIMPTRRFGDIMERKWELIQAGRAVRPPPL